MVVMPRTRSALAAPVDLVAWKKTLSRQAYLSPRTTSTSSTQATTAKWGK